MGYAIVAADHHRSRHHYSVGISDRMHSQSVARMGCLGLQRSSGKYTWPDMPTVFSVVGADSTGGNCIG